MHESLIIFMALFQTWYEHPCLSFTEEPRTGPSTPDISPQGRAAGKDLLHQPDATQEAVGLLCCKGTFWLMFYLVFTRTPSFFSAKLLSSLSFPSLSWCLGLFLFRGRTLHLSVKFHEVPVSPFLHPLEVSLNGSATPWCISQSS